MRMLQPAIKHVLAAVSINSPVQCLNRVRVQMVSDAGSGDLHQLWTAAWDPHDHSRLLTAGGSNIQVLPVLLLRILEKLCQLPHAASCTAQRTTACQLRMAACSR